MGKADLKHGGEHIGASGGGEGGGSGGGGGGHINRFVFDLGVFVLERWRF